MSGAIAVVDELRALFAGRGSAAYFGESVSQLEHALQCAWLAERAGASPRMIVAALCHDVGHLLHGAGEDCAERGVDAHHEAIGARFLAARFGQDLSMPVLLHVSAKRFLASRSESYRASLSVASAQSLALQGGPMSPWEADRFANEPFAGDAVALRRWDDEAKVVGLATPDLDHFLGHAQRCRVRSADAA